MKRWKAGKGYVLHDCKENGEWVLHSVWSEEAYIKESIKRADDNWIANCNCNIEPPPKIKNLMEAYSFYDKIKDYAQ